eukprot:g17196.t1
MVSSCLQNAVARICGGALPEEVSDASTASKPVQQRPKVPSLNLSGPNSPLRLQREHGEQEDQGDHNKGSKASTSAASSGTVFSSLKVLAARSPDGPGGKGSSLGRDEILPGQHPTVGLGPLATDDAFAEKKRELMQESSLMSAELREKERFLDDAVAQADNVSADFDIGRTLGCGSFSRIRLALLKGSFGGAQAGGSFQVGASTSSSTGGARRSRKSFNHKLTNDLVSTLADGTSVLPFALKTLRKKDIVALKQEEHTLRERDVLALLRQHPFIVTLYRAYQDKHFLYMLLEYVPGGEIFTILRQMGSFPKEMCYFYACQLVLTFEYMHRYEIAYRDTKAENFLIDADGYLRVVDFGFAKPTPEKTYTFCGTPEYLAPEILLNVGHDHRVDWWCLGVFIYEMLVGQTPFAAPPSSGNNGEGGDNLMECYRKILETEVAVWGADAGLVQFEEELLLGLLVSSPDARLGAREGAADIKAQNYFFETPWDYILRKEIPAPYVPPLEDALDTRHYQEYPDSDVDDSDVPVPDDLFEGFEHF